MFESRQRPSTREYCDDGMNQRNNERITTATSPADSISRRQRRHTRHLTCSVFLVSLWLCTLGTNCVSTAEESLLPSVSSSSSSSISSSSSSVSKAQIVIPSHSIQDEENIGGYDQFDIAEKSFIPTFSRGISNNPVAFLSREESRLYQSSRKILPLFSTSPLGVHRSGSSDIDDGASELYSDGSEMIPSPSRRSFKKTGTTIAGCVVPGGSGGDGPYVVLAADTRATEGTIVADKQCDKIHKLASNCRCCGAGTSADLDKVTRQVLYQMALQELQNRNIGNGNIHGMKETGSSESAEVLYPDHGDGEIGDDNEPLLWMRPVSIEVLCNVFQNLLFRSGGQLGANLIVGGVWNKKAYLRAIHPHGSTDVDLPFTALGSGGLAAMAVLEEGYRSSLTLEEGIELVKRAILSGIQNDLGSGSQVDLCVIDPNGVCRQTRAVIPEEELLPDGSGVSSSTTKDPSIRTNRLLEILGRGDETVKEEIRDHPDSNHTSSGVNGFGNQPFAIENTKQRMVSVEMDKAKKKEIWDRVLGL